MRTVILFILLCIGVPVFSQNFFTTYTLGAAGYKGDLQESAFRFVQSRGVWGVGCMLECSDRMFANVDFNYGKIGANDRYNPLNRARNLNFKSDVAELSARFEYNLFDLYQVKATPYFFVGIGVFRFSPYIEFENGNRGYLWEYDTEGQGFYEGRQKYKLTQWCLPFGGGFQYALSNKVRAAFSLGWRYTPTDYLDDVSTTYIDKDLLTRMRGENAVIIAYRGNQLTNGSPYPAAGTARGNPDTKDAYFFLTATLKVRMTVKGRKSESEKHAGSVECPY